MQPRHAHLLPGWPCINLGLLDMACHRPPAADEGFATDLNFTP